MQLGDVVDDSGSEYLPTDGETAPKHCNICNEEICWLLGMLWWCFVVCTA